MRYRGLPPAASAREEFRLRHCPQFFWWPAFLELLWYVTEGCKRAYTLRHCTDLKRRCIAKRSSSCSGIEKRHMQWRSSSLPSVPKQTRRVRHQSFAARGLKEGRRSDALRSTPGQDANQKVHCLKSALRAVGLRRQLTTGFRLTLYSCQARNDHLWLKRNCLAPGRCWNRSSSHGHRVLLLRQCCA